MKRWKHELFVFPPKKTLTLRMHCSIAQSSCSVTSKRSIDWFLESSGHEVFSPEFSLNQPKATRVCIRSINQSNRSISVRLFFLFCSLVNEVSCQNFQPVKNSSGAMWTYFWSRAFYSLVHFLCSSVQNSDNKCSTWSHNGYSDHKTSRTNSHHGHEIL